LSLPSATVEEAAETLYHTMAILEDDQDGLTWMRNYEILGVAVEIYR
jgi:hypothetical protein